MDKRTKQLRSEVRRNPWIAVHWKSCRESKIAHELFSLVDETIFERDLKKALALSHALVGMADMIKDPHLRSKAAAALGSAFRSVGLVELALDQLHEAEDLAQPCDDCLGNVSKRLAVVFDDQGAFEWSLAQFDKAFGHFERTLDRAEKCSVLLGRGHACHRLEHHQEGFGNICDAISLMAPEMPSRYFIAAAINVLTLAVAPGVPNNIATAERLIRDLQEMTRGYREHARTRAVLRYVRGLAYDKAGNQKNATRTLEKTIPALDRLWMIPEKKNAMADLALLRCKGRQYEPNERTVLRLLDDGLRDEDDPATIALIKQAKANPSPANILAWRAAVVSYVPSMEPIAKTTAIL